MLSIRKINKKLHQRVRQFFYQEDSIQVDELQVTQVQIAEMEEIINPYNIILDFSKSYFNQIKQNLEQASTQSSIFFCFLSLKKIIEIPNNPTFDKKLIESDDITVKESLEVITEIQQEKESLQNSQEFHGQNISFQDKCEYQTQLFEAIYFFVTAIQDKLSLDPEFMENFSLAKPMLYDITQIYLNYYLRLYRIYIEANSQKFLLEYYDRGQILFRFACSHFNEYQTQNLFNLLYNFRTVSILAIILSNKLQFIYKVMQDFLNYHYQSLENMEQLFKFEQTLNSTIFDYCLSVSNQKMYQLLFQEIQNLDQKFINNCFILELKWMLFSRYLSSDLLEEQHRVLIETHINNPMSWKDLFIQLINFGSRRLQILFINLEKFANSNSIIKNWQDALIDIIKSFFKIQPKYYFQQDPIQQLFKFILNSLQEILMYNQKKNKSSERILQLLEDSINHPLAKEYRFQKKLLDILIISDLACYGDNIQNYIFNVVSPSSFTFDPINTAKYILICNQSCCRQKIINHIYCSIIRYKKMSTMDPRTNLCQIIQQLHQMIVFFEKDKTVNENVKFLSQQIRFSLRSILTIFVINDEQLLQENTDCFLNQFPLLNLEKAFQEIVVNFDAPSRNTFDLSCALQISQYLMKILDLANSFKNCQLEDLYDILICQLKIIQAIQKFMFLHHDIIALNQFFDNIDQSLYQYVVKVLIHHQKLSKNQMNYVIEEINILIFQDHLTKNMSGISENTQKYLNYRLIKIFLSVIFECELPSEYIISIVNGIFELVNQNRFQFSSILNKTILLLAIENNKEQNQIKQKMIDIINLICETSFSNIQLKCLLRLCFGGSNKLLIFRKQIPDCQQGQQLVDSVFENDGDLINIFFEPQLNLVNKYSFQQGLSDFLSIFNRLLEVKYPFIFFKDYNSFINLPIKFQITKGFTICFEIQFINHVDQQDPELLVSQEAILSENRQQYYEIITLYSEKSDTKLSGMKIIISQKCVQIRQFKFYNKLDILGPVFQSYEIKVPESPKYNYQLNYNNGYFTVYVNGQLCKSEQKKIIEINQIIQIDLGKSMESTTALSYIFATAQFDYETNIFRGKMFNFILTDQVQNGLILEQPTKTKYLIQFSKFNKMINPFVLLDLGINDLFEINDTIQNKEDNIQNDEDSIQHKEDKQKKNQINSISYKQISNVQDILKHCNIQSLILHIFQEILNQQNLQEYESQISNLLNTLLNKIILLDDEIQNIFFKQDFNFFIKILQSLTQNVKLHKLLGILDNFNQKLSETNQKYYLKFTNHVIYDFSLLEQFINDEVILNNYFMGMLQKYEIPFENVIQQIIQNTQLQILETKQYFLFLSSYIEKPFYKNIKTKHENLFYKFVNDMQLFAQLFEYQDLSSDYLQIIKQYLQLINQKYQQALKTNLNKYSQNTLIIYQKNDILYLAAILNSCKKKPCLSNKDNINWNFINLLIFIEELHKETLQYNSNIVDSLILEILCLRDNLAIDNYAYDILKTIIQEIKSINSLCVIINLIAFLLNNKVYIFDSKFKPSIINQLSHKLSLNMQTGHLLEISNNSMLEFVFDSLHYKDHSSKSQEIYLDVLKSKICYQHLNSIDLGRLIKINSHQPEIFQDLLIIIKDQLQNQKVQNQIVILANLIKMLNIIKKDCFAKDQNSEFKKQCSSLLNFYIDLFQQRNFFKFNLKKKQKETLQIENYLICGGLFGLFTEIFLIAIQNQSLEFVIDNILKLLNIYLEEMNKKTDDPLVHEVYGLFNYCQDKNGIKFPIIGMMFKKVIEEGQQKKILEIINQIEQQQEKQFKGNNNIFQVMIDEFRNSIQKIENYQNQLEQKYEGEKNKQLEFSENNSQKRMSQSTCDQSQSYIRKKVDEVFIESQIQFYNSQINLYVDFYLWNDVRNISDLKKFIKALNEEILEKQQNVTKDYKIKWRHSNLVDYENKIIFKKQISLKNKIDYQQQSQNHFLDTCNQSQTYNNKECKEFDGTLKNILNKCEEVKISIIQCGIKFFDPFSNDDIVISNQNCKVTIMKYQSQEKSFLIKQFDQSYQSFFHLIINSEEHFKQLKKHFSKLELLSTKSISDIKKKLSPKWQQGVFSNYQYIYLLNSHSGRNLLDRNNYFIYPWTTVHLNNSYVSISRTFSQSIFNQKPTKNYGFFHSSEKLLNYFLSTNQEEDSVNQTQISKSDDNSINEMKEERKPILIKFMDELQKLGESMPEFYSNPQFFQEYQLPNWVLTQTPEEFIYIMRAHLESRIVQELLPHWIDLVFGINSTCQGKQFEQQFKGNELKSQNQFFSDSNRANMNVCKFGQSMKQLFTEKHIPRKIFHNFFGDQPQIKITTRRLLYEGSEKIISSYYYSCQQFVLITEKGTGIILDVNHQLFQKMSLESDCLIVKQKKELKTKQPLTDQLICFIDFENQNFSDKQESQQHIIESERLSLFQSYTIFFILGGYSNGEFRSFKGNSLKHNKYCTQNNSNIQCIRICHVRCVLIIGQEDGAISLWKITQDYEISITPFLIISSHVYSITNIDCSASQILSVDLINEVHIHYYNGQLLKKIQLICYGRITYCQISYTMNLYIFLNSFNKLMVYDQNGQIYIHPIEIPQKINNIIPLTPFSSQFIYATDSGFYFDDIFIIKMKQDGVVIEKSQDKKIYDQNFSCIKAVQGNKLLLCDKSVNNISTFQIIFQQSEFSQLRFQTVGCDNGNFWCLYNEEEILQYYEKKLKCSGLK